MMSYIWVGMMIVAVLFGALSGRIDLVSQAALSEGKNAIELMITLMGTICLWNGLMKIAQESKLTKKLAKFLSPVTNFLFERKDKNKDSKAMEAITMNLTANLLGLGNAATPLGLIAMRELDKENKHRSFASNNMIIFVVLNTASLQLIPTTTAALRLSHGSANPFDILPCTWIASGCSLICGVIVAKTLNKITGKKYE